MIQFNKKRGLCGNLACMYPYDTEIQLNTEMMRQFHDAGFNLRYPFGGEHVYHNHQNAGTQHLLSKRRAWARGHYQYPPANQSKELTEFYGEWYKWAVAQSN